MKAEQSQLEWSLVVTLCSQREHCLGSDRLTINLYGHCLDRGKIAGKRGRREARTLASQNKAYNDRWSPRAHAGLICLDSSKKVQQIMSCQ